MDGRPVRESLSEIAEFALPIYANPLGNVLGGRIMHLVDLAAATAAIRHCRSAVVTASVDSMSFLRPIRIGQLITLKASVNRVFRSSMEVGVKVLVEDLRQASSSTPTRPTSRSWLSMKKANRTRYPK